MSSNKHTRLIEKALRLKKAWLCSVALLGIEITEAERAIPDFGRWENQRLKQYTENLEDDIDPIARLALLDWKRSHLSRTVEWFASAYESWERAGFGLFDLGRVQEVEMSLGLLGHRKNIECPPYAQVLLQGWHGAAIRHPEYHLAQDLSLLYDLFFDSEAILEDANRRREQHSSQDSQSLARSVILTSFNLLESFASGLAVGWLMENPNPSDDVLNTLQGKRRNGRDLSLRERLTLFPSVISGKPRLDDTQPPFAKLFGECKQRRDSFVHCEPGSTPTKWGYVKEDRFHDVDAAVVRETVRLTVEAICVGWKQVHDTDRPRWLPELDSNGRFPHVGVMLVLAKELQNSEIQS